MESTYADVFQGLGKFLGEPYKLRLKPDAVPAKHRPRKVPVHLQDAFHEEVERLVKDRCIGKSHRTYRMG